MRYQKRLLLSGLIAVLLVGFGVMANWYLVQGWIDQPVETPNPRLRQGFGGQAYQQLYDELLRPSVLISTSNGRGSGVVISSTAKATYILSAAHVVGDEDTVDVTFYYYTPDSVDTTITASVIATDTLKDLALLRTYTYKPYPYVVKLAPKDYTPYIFTPVWVVGCSLGYPPRPTSGEVTAINNHWGINAPIWPGNSGGGVFLKDTNELIGIAILVKVYRGQLVSTMGSIVTLQDIYEFIKHSPVGLIGHGPTGSALNRGANKGSIPTLADRDLRISKVRSSLRDSKKGGD